MGSPLSAGTVHVNAMVLASVARTVRLGWPGTPANVVAETGFDQLLRPRLFRAATR